MARKIQPRHIAKEIEAKREVPKPPRFNQISSSDNENYMYPLNRDLTDVPSALDFGVTEIHRTIVEKAGEPAKVGITLYLDAENATDAFAYFLDRIADATGNVNSINFDISQRVFSYEGTIYNVTQLEIPDREYIETNTLSGERTLHPVGMRRHIIVVAEAVPEIIKIKGRVR